MRFTNEVPRRGPHCRGAAATVVSCLLAVGVTAQAELQRGSAAPPFRARNVEGLSVVSGQLKANVAILDFWTTWAKPCGDAMQQWEKLHQKYSGQGLLVIGIAMDEDPKPVKPFLKQKGITYQILLDADGRISERYKVKEQPTTYIIDRRGIIREVFPGYKTGLEKIVEQNLVNLLKEK